MRLIPAAALASLALAGVAHAAPTITEYSSGLTTNQSPWAIATGPDGGLWFTEKGGSGAIGRITPAGVIAEFTAGLTPNDDPLGIAAGPDGNVWFSEQASPGRIGRITPAGVITEFTAGLTNDAQPTDIVAGPDGNLWFTGQKSPGRIGRITPAGVITEFTAGLGNDLQPAGITAGPDGNLWFTERKNPGGIGRITPGGVITEFTTGLTGNATPLDITTGPDGNLWFTGQADPGRIGRITPAGVITEFTTGLSTNSAPTEIVAGDDGNLWFTEQANPGRIGRITTTGVITEFTTGLTGSAKPSGIAAGPDGNIWFTEQANPGRIGRITLPPGVAGIGATSVAHTSASIQASVSPRAQATTYVLEYGPTAAYGSQTAAASAGSSGSVQTVTVPLSGLAPSSTYHVRVVATNGTGTTAGPDTVFTTAAPPPSVSSPSAHGVNHDSAVLDADVTPNSLATTYQFEYGPTVAYGTQTPTASAGAGVGAQSVSSAVAGLVPETTYHVRVVAMNSSGTITGPDATFTTGVAPAILPTPDPRMKPVAPPAPPPPPALGRKVTSEVISGTVTVRPRKSSAFVTLEGAASLPVGSTIDATSGVLELTSALPGGGAQTGTFWGGRFIVGQNPRSGMTTLRLSRPAACRTPARAARVGADAFAKRRPPSNRLWGKDDKGRFSTHGANSAATVRGTKWLTEERCDGTLTRVVTGRVLVRDLRTGRSVLLTAGHAHLARARA